MQDSLLLDQFIHSELNLEFQASRRRYKKVSKTLLVGLLIGHVAS